ncbi:MAG: hypothetical protein MSG64_20385 [Pyrinomonadaceae bacterium MAG19_C2-C3]|nr:hypothetical protein [Pyrinomonadaceae bacterium MAG19_C2-C3]
MRLIYLSAVILLCLACAGVFYARTQPSISRQNSPLRLSTSIVSQKYCAGDAELDSLQTELRLCYTNVGQQPLILYKGSNNISRVMVSRSAAEAAAGRFEANGSVTSITDGSHAETEGAVPGEAFIVLPPGASYQTEADIAVLVARGDTSKVAGAVAAGEYVLQVEVPTWSESDDLAKKLRHRWRQSGFLWYDPLTSIPMPLKVEKQRAVVDCS